MDEVVTSERLLAWEYLSTLITSNQLLIRMNNRVLVEAIFAFEMLPTIFALKCFPTSMSYVVVCAKFAFVVEGFPTVAALEHSIVRMKEEMPLLLCLVLEPLGTVPASK